MPKILWTIRENQVLTAERFERFREKARQAGISPAAALQRFILEFIGERSDYADPE